MPIDYTRWDNLDCSSSEDEDKNLAMERFNNAQRNRDAYPLQGRASSVPCKPDDNISVDNADELEVEVGTIVSVNEPGHRHHGLTGTVVRKNDNGDWTVRFAIGTGITFETDDLVPIGKSAEKISDYVCEGPKPDVGEAYVPGDEGGFLELVRTTPIGQISNCTEAAAALWDVAVEMAPENYFYKARTGQKVPKDLEFMTKTLPNFTEDPFLKEGMVLEIIGSLKDAEPTKRHCFWFKFDAIAHHLIVEKVVGKPAGYRLYQSYVDHSPQVEGARGPHLNMARGYTLEEWVSRDTFKKFTNFPNPHPHHKYGQGKVFSHTEFMELANLMLKVQSAADKLTLAIVKQLDFGPNGPCPSKEEDFEGYCAWFGDAQKVFSYASRLIHEACPMGAVRELYKHDDEDDPGLPYAIEAYGEIEFYLPKKETTEFRKLYQQLTGEYPFLSTYFFLLHYIAWKISTKENGGFTGWAWCQSEASACIF